MQLLSGADGGEESVTDMNRCTLAGQTLPGVPGQWEVIDVQEMAGKRMAMFRNEAGLMREHLVYDMPSGAFLFMTDKNSIRAAFMEWLAEEE